MIKLYCHPFSYCKHSSRNTFVYCIYGSIPLVSKPWQTGVCDHVS